MSNLHLYPFRFAGSGLPTNVPGILTSHGSVKWLGSNICPTIPLAKSLPTVPGVGYRFVPDVAEKEVAEQEEQTPAQSLAKTGPVNVDSGPALQLRRSPIQQVAVFTVALVLVLALGFALYPRHKKVRRLYVRRNSPPTLQKEP